MCMPIRVQVVAVDWIFSSRIEFVGLEVIFGPYQWRAAPGLFLTFWKSLGGSLGEQVLLKNTFLIKIVGKMVKRCLIVKQRHI